MGGDYDTIKGERKMSVDYYYSSVSSNLEVLGAILLRLVTFSLSTE